MKTKYLFFVLLIFFAGSLMAGAQQKSRITGRISDAVNGEFLPVANVYLEGTNIGTTSDVDGYFTIYDVKPGTYTLKVSYIGYKTFSAKITVQPGKDVKINIKMEPESLELHDVKVVGQRQGQMKALNMQKEADNQVNVVAYEQMASFPDMNTAEVLQRLPGVSITRNMGEGQFVSIRGTDPRFTQVKVNGEVISTPEDEERYVSLNTISATQLGSIEVTKSPTPKMDGDAVGGVVNLKTRSAFDSDKKIARVRVGGGWAVMSDKPNFRADASFASQLGKARKFGISLNANYQMMNLGSNVIEPRWSNAMQDINFNPLPMVFADIEMHVQRSSRARYGFQGDFEFRPNSRSRYKIGGMINHRNDQQTRNIRRIRANKGVYINPGLVYNARSYLQLQDRLESQTIDVVNASGQNDLGWIKIDYNASFSYGLQEKKGEGQIKAEFQSDQRYTLGIDTNSYRIPVFSYYDLQGSDFIPIAEDSITDPGKFALDQLDWRIQHTTNHTVNAGLNFAVPYTLVGNTGSFEFGGKYRIQTKDRNNTRIKNRHTDYKVPLDPFLRGTYGSFLKGHYSFGPEIDPTPMRAYYEENKDDPEIFEPEYRWIESLGETYNAKEQIIAGYAMFRQVFGKILFIAGARLEHTTTNYKGYFLNLDSNGNYISSQDTSDTRRYIDIFPNVQGRWRVTPNTNLRLAYTNGIMRPNYYSLVPYYIVSDKDRQILRGNPNLKPSHSVNLDFSFEHYFQKVGIASVAVFYKSLTDMAYTKLTRDTVPGDYYNWETIQVVNGGNAKLVGIELNWSQQFTFLPGFLNGFGIYLNYTHNQAFQSEIFGREFGKRIPGLSPDVGNVALTYEKYGLTARIAFNYNLNVLEEIGEIEAEDVWLDNYNRLDFSGNYKLGKGFEIFLEWNNLLNSPKREFYGDTRYTYSLEYVSWAFNAGLKWRL